MTSVRQATTAACLSAGLAAVSPVGGPPVHRADQSEKISGYAEFKQGDTVMVDGQRVVAVQGTRVSGAKTLPEIPLGYEVKVKGHRDKSGALIAEQVQAKPNGTDGTEQEIIAASNQAEETWVKHKMMFEPADSGKIIKIGEILESGPYVDRARKIIDKLRPSYVPANALRVRAVKTDQWNASAMANGAIWVYTGLMDNMSDEEMAIVLGHELTHYTHEHVRRQQSKGTLAQILGVGASIALTQISNPTAQQMAAFGGQLGLSALMSGYSREFEDQADRVGLRYVYEAGFDPSKGPGLWEKFKQKYGEEDKLTNFFTGDHSRPTERIRNIQRQIQLNNYTTLPKKTS
jgi:Zn-dependent protease with chaperone function